MSCMGKLESSKNKGTELGSHVLRSVIELKQDVD